MPGNVSHGDFVPPVDDQFSAMADGRADEATAIGDFDIDIVVTVRNEAYLPSLTGLEMAGLSPAAGLVLFEYAMVDGLTSFPLRSEVFSVDEIKRVTVELWRDVGAGRQIDLYVVVPQPEERVHAGLTFVLDIFVPVVPCAASSVVLGEFSAWTLDLLVLSWE